VKLNRFILHVTILAALSGLPSMISAQDEPVTQIYGLVDSPLNVTYSEFLRLPMTSVNASCICVGAPPESPGVNSFVVYTHNWTGVRVSDLLALAGVQDGAVDVVFRDDTQYSSSLPLDVVLEPDKIIAVYADGKTLNRDQGYPFRLVAPCWWGYKWVKFITRVEVVDYDHLGFWESHGYPDIARISDCDTTASNPTVFTPAAQSLAVLGVSMMAVAVYLSQR
jgi:DMSO/TMAO reductase YedYZ molybdopterin-dependent catalytic subunit